MGRNLKLRFGGRDFDIVDFRVIPGGAVQYCIEDEPGSFDWINESDAVVIGELVSNNVANNIAIDYCDEGSPFIEQSSPWIKCSERLPKEDFDDGYQMVFVAISDGEDTWRFGTDYIRNGKWELNPKSNIVYWMPIPPLY